VATRPFQEGILADPARFRQFLRQLQRRDRLFRKTDRIGEADWHRNERQVKEAGYVTTLLGREAASLISGHDATTPLFLYLSFNAPQMPLQAPREYLEMYRDIADETRRAMWRWSPHSTTP